MRLRVIVYEVLQLCPAPASVLPNWVAEFERCAPDLKVRSS